MKLKKFIVWALERFCIHYIPVISPHLGWGLCRMALLSSDLDDKWETGLWKGPDNG